MNSATNGKAELALPTLAIAQVPVAELPVRDRLLLWENSQLVQFRVQNEATQKSEDKNDAAQPAATDPCAGGVLIEKWCHHVSTCRVRSRIGRGAFAVLKSRELLPYLLST